MLEINSLVERLRKDFPDLVFEAGEGFMFRPPRTVYYDLGYLGLPDDKIALLTLHEAAHAVLKHKDYDGDVLLLKMESEAWERVRQMCGGYGVDWDEDFVQDRLDSYRDWLHSQSLCPVCRVSGYQDNRLRYHCPMCGKTYKK